MRDVIYITFDEKANPPEIMALNVDVHSYGWAGPKEFARPPYFKVSGVISGKLDMRQLDNDSDEVRKLQDVLQKDGEVPSSVAHIPESDVSKYFL